MWSTGSMRSMVGEDPPSDARNWWVSWYSTTPYVSFPSCPDRFFELPSVPGQGGGGLQCLDSSATIVLVREIISMPSNDVDFRGRLLRLAAADNVAVATADFPAGAVAAFGRRADHARRRRRPWATRRRSPPSRREKRSSSSAARSARPCGQSVSASTSTPTTSKATTCRREPGAERLFKITAPRLEAGATKGKTSMQGFLRSDGRKGIRNYVVVAYLVECAHHVAREITLPFREQGRPPDRLSRLLSERLCRSHHAADLHASERRRRAAGLAGLREFRPQRPGRNRSPIGPAGRDAGHPGEPAARERRSATAARGSSRPCDSCKTRPAARSALPTWSWARSAAAPTPPAG